MVQPDTLAMHLRVVSKYYTLIHLDEWVSRYQNGAPLPSPACAITFDDGWADNFEYAYPILKAAQVPASIFIVTDMVGKEYQFWPGRLAAIIRHHRLPQQLFEQDAHPGIHWLLQLLPAPIAQFQPSTAAIDAIIEHAKMFSDHEVTQHVSHIETLLGFSGNSSSHTPEMLSWEQINTMTEDGLIKIGSHTRSHARLNQLLPEQDMRSEIEQSSIAIKHRTGISPSLFCYPNGDHTPLAIELVSNQYHAACSTIPGVNAPGQLELHLLKRFTMHEDISDNESLFICRILGLF
ncbi:MAG: polysaccharide deacetylase family protein [Gammaproteobacteria bacterium]|nr:polysaccharide deacetylase family protein [Gammaproteobacteria bacterium]